MRLLTHSSALALVASSFLALTSAHSWLECTDYRIDQNSEDAKTWNPAKCQGRARCTGSLSDPGFMFGLDKGFDSHSDKCQCARGSEKDNAPKATYTPGQRVCLAYPPKNHVAAPCTNQYIPDAGVRITRSKVGATSDDETASKSYKQGNGDHVSGTIDYKGFQHCPNFCSNEDKALCTMCFDLESDLEPGEYSFKWIWDFHGESDIYTSCWEANVGGKGQQPQAPGNSSTSGNNHQATVATGNPVSYVASPVPTPEATQAVPTSTPGPMSTDTSSSPSPTPTVYAAVAGEADVDCEDELDVAGDEDDCEDELNMPGTDADCEDELDMPTGNNEVGADADLAYSGNSNGQSADLSSPSSPAKTEDAQKPETGGNYGSVAGSQESNIQSPSAAAATGGGYGHDVAQNPATGGGYEEAPISATDGAQTPSSDNNTPTSNSGYGASNNNNNQGSAHHGHEYGHSNGGHYPHSHGNNRHPGHDNNSKYHEGQQQPPATSSGGQSESAPAPVTEVDPGCEQGLTLAKDKPAETSDGGGDNNNSAKTESTPVAYPSDSQSLETAPLPPSAYTPETEAEAQNSELTTPDQAASTPETGADADHGQEYGHQGQGQPVSDGAATPAPAAAGTSGEAAVTEDPDCAEKLPYAYGNETPAAVQGEAEDCDKGIPIASEAPGKGEQDGGQGGGHHGPHRRNHYQGESYSFVSEQKSLEGGDSTESGDVNAAGIVVPYPGE